LQPLERKRLQATEERDDKESTPRKEKNVTGEDGKDRINRQTNQRLQADEDSGSSEKREEKRGQVEKDKPKRWEGESRPKDIQCEITLDT
jgi:hypothetical protein